MNYFLVVHTDGDMRYEPYVLPAGVLSFRKQHKWNAEEPSEKKGVPCVPTTIEK